MGGNSTTYTTMRGTEYTTSSTTNAHRGEEVGRMVYISMKQAEELKKRAGNIGPKERDQLFEQKPYDEQGGRILYEDLAKELRLSGTVDRRNPEFEERLGFAEENAGVESVLDE